MITASGVPLMKGRLIRIGNSRGIRLPKIVIDEAGLTDEVEIEVRPGAVVITAAPAPRSGWAAAARRQANHGEDRLVIDPAPTVFDDEAWEW